MVTGSCGGGDEKMRENKKKKSYSKRGRRKYEMALVLSFF